MSAFLAYGPPTGPVRAAMPEKCIRACMPCGRHTRGRRRQAVVTPAVQRDIDRVIAIWARAGRGGMPWLLGDFSAVDDQDFQL